MKKALRHNSCRHLPPPSGLCWTLPALALLGVSSTPTYALSPGKSKALPDPQTAPANGQAAPAEQATSAAVPAGANQQSATPASQSPPATGAPSPSATTPPSPATEADRPPGRPTPDFHFKAITAETEGSYNFATGDVAYTGGVEVVGPDVTIRAYRIEGNFNSEIVFSGDAKITTNGATSQADAIHFFPARRAYRLDNPRAILQPSFLQNRVDVPVYLTGGELFGTQTGYALGENFIATTCVEPFHHYELRIRSAELMPGKKLVLKRVSVFLFGLKLITLPTLTIPLDQHPRIRRRPQPDYLPEFGRNIPEGYYARFPYEFAAGSVAATYIRTDITQKKGLGGRFEQEYIAGKQESGFNTNNGGGFSSGGFNLGGLTNGGTITNAYGYGTTGNLPRLGSGLGPQNGGLLTAQGYLAEGFNRDFSASFRHQQGIGGGNRIGFDTELQRNSFFAFSAPSSTSNHQNTRFDFNHNDGAHGVNGDVTLSLDTSNSFGANTSQFTGTYRQSFDFASVGANRNSLTYDFNLSRYLSTSAGLLGAAGTFNRMARLDSDFQFQHGAREYALNVQANKSTPIGEQTNQGSFGSLERLPELSFTADSYNFKSGFLRRLPLHLDVGEGNYSEPSSKIQTNRTLVGLGLQDVPVLRGRTEVTTALGFEQRLYGDGAAQYTVRDQAHLRQHLGGRSGFDINYQYEQPRGGTPFAFDPYSRTHYATAEGGYLNDSRFQLTARVGYDFLGTSRRTPWQTLSTRMLWRPTPSVRFDALATYDPNTSKLFSVSNTFRFRGRSNFAMDISTRYDPQQHKFSTISNQFDIPLGRTWRTSGLYQYNGFTRKFDSENLQIVHEWDCLEASLTYTRSTLGFSNDSQFFFSLRIKGLPFFHAFTRTPTSSSPGAGLDNIY